MRDPWDPDEWIRRQRPSLWSLFWCAQSAVFGWLMVIEVLGGWGTGSTPPLEQLERLLH